MTGGGAYRLAVLTNIIAPYRAPLYRYLSERFQTVVILSGCEDNRRWDGKPLSDGFKVQTAWGITIKRRVRNPKGVTVDFKYTHINPGYLWALFRFRPDAIISHEMGFRSLLAIVYGLIFRIPVWVWWGGTLHTERRLSFVKRILRRLVFANLTPRWISYGETSTEYLQSLGIPRARILQVQNCVDDRLYHERVEPYPLSLPRPRALFVGQLIGRKGIYQLLEATARLQHSGLQFSLVMVGDGPEAKRVDSEAERLGVTSLYRIPYAEPEQMPGIYRSCDFLVFPTFEDVWGLVVNEALLSGLPVIASIYAGCSRELLPMENVFDPTDATSFEGALRRALLGSIARPDRVRLKAAREVAGMIAADIVGTIRGRAGALSSWEGGGQGRGSGQPC